MTVWPLVLSMGTSSWVQFGLRGPSSHLRVQVYGYSLVHRVPRPVHGYEFMGTVWFTWPLVPFTGTSLWVQFGSQGPSSCSWVRVHGYSLVYVAPRPIYGYKFMGTVWFTGSLVLFMGTSSWVQLWVLTPEDTRQVRGFNHTSGKLHQTWTLFGTVTIFWGLMPEDTQQV
jgi:hypothetical protein